MKRDDIQVLEKNLLPSPAE